MVLQCVCSVQFSGRWRKGIKIFLNLFIANPSPNVSRSSVYIFSKKKRTNLLLNPVTIHKTYTTVEWKDFGLNFYPREEGEKGENEIRLSRRCSKTQIHLLCKHLMHHCYVSCCLRMLSSCNIISPWIRRQGIIMHFTLRRPPSTPVTFLDLS